MRMKMTTRPAWYSEKAAELHGSTIWRKADGTEVEVTIVGESMETIYNWDDKVYVGEVTDFIRTAQIGTYQRWRKLDRIRWRTI
jgi:hypothetical protein